MRVDRLVENYAIAVKYTHFPLHPDTPRKGLTLEELFAGRNMDIPAVQARMRELMAAGGLPYGERTRTYNSRLAQELAKWAETQPGGESIHEALFKAYLVEGRNIALMDVLLDVVGRVGLDVEQAHDVLEQRTMRSAVDADWQRSRELGVTGVPTFVVCNRGVVGAQPYEVLEKLVVEAGAVRRED